MAGEDHPQGGPDGSVDATVDVPGLSLAVATVPVPAPAEIADDTAAAAAAAIDESPEDSLLRIITARKAPALRLPRPGPCVYLIIDKSTLREIDEEAFRKFSAEINLVNNVADYDVSTHKKNIRIIGTAERAANSLLAIATSLKQIAPKIRILLGKGTIEHQGRGSFEVKGIPDESTLDSWQAQKNDIYLTENLAADIREPGSREGSHCEIQVTESGAEGLMTLKGYKPRVERNTGGPDELIGYEEPLARLKGFLKDEDTKLVFLNGEAGIGKSRILSEVLGRLPAHILCSLDAADRGVPGASLVTLANQVAQIIKGDPDAWGDDLRALTDFSRKTRAEKIAYAQRHPRELAELCFNGLQLRTLTTSPKSVFILEDLHNADHFSEPILAGIAERYARETDGKTLVSMRPEEAYRSSAQEHLKNNVARSLDGQEAVQDVTLKGLNFADEEISRRFAYHCIPVDRRGGKTVDQMGTWHKALGKVAGNSPFIMTTLMRTVLETEGALNTEGDIINVDPKLISNLSKIDPDDPNALTTYLHQRIANLSDNARIVIQAMALAGGRLIGRQIDKIIGKMTGNTPIMVGDAAIMVGDAPIKTAKVFEALVEGGFIHKTNDKTDEGDYAIWKFQQELLIPFVISSIIDPEYKRNMSRYLYRILADDRHTHPDTRLALLQGIVTGSETPEPDDDDDDEIWNLYLNAAMEALEDARAHNNTGRAAAIAESILRKTQGSERIQTAITDLKEGRAVPEALAKLAVAALMAAAESALNSGRFKEVTGHTDELTQINGLNLDLVDIDRVNLMLFEKAYLSREKEDMKQIFADSIERVDTIPETAKAIARIKIAFREANPDEVSELFAEHKAAFEVANEAHKASHEEMPSPDYVEMLRLVKVRIPFEAIKAAASKIDNTTRLDSDCLMQPEALSEALKAKLEDEILPALKEIIKITKEFPTILNSHSELALLDEIAEIERFRGTGDSTDKAYKEAWRIADQMQNHDAAARIAKGRAHNLVTQALLASTDGRHATTDIEKLKLAIAVLNGEGTISISQLDKGHIRSLYLRIDRIRAIALLALHYEKDMGKNMSALKKEMTPYFDQAFEDFEIINREHGAEIEPEIAYYLLGPFNYVLQAAHKLKYSIPKDIADPKKYPHMTTSACVSGLEFGENVTDRGLNLREAVNKRKGLYEIYRGLLNMRDSKL